MCFTTTILDGLVYARSAFHNSMNYRSVMVLGEARAVDGDEKLAGLEAVTEHMTRGRWADSRMPTQQELKATSVIRMEIEEASAKIRTGGPKEEEVDYALPIWGGHVPLTLRHGEPVDDGRVLLGVEVPEYVRNYRR
jgi:nitroimidazol reductase NimA-like FMN-containing flavoprotein (pyridoxamine 5'-phosphate oxidase superfamily)